MVALLHGVPNCSSLVRLIGVVSPWCSYLTELCGWICSLISPYSRYVQLLDGTAQSYQLVHLLCAIHQCSYSMQLLDGVTQCNYLLRKTCAIVRCGDFVQLLGAVTLRCSLVLLLNEFTRY